MYSQAAAPHIQPLVWCWTWTDWTSPSGCCLLVVGFDLWSGGFGRAATVSACWSLLSVLSVRPSVSCFCSCLKHLLVVMEGLSGRRRKWRLWYHGWFHGSMKLLWRCGACNLSSAVSLSRFDHLERSWAEGIDSRRFASVFANFQQLAYWQSSSRSLSLQIPKSSFHFDWSCSYHSYSQISEAVESWIGIEGPNAPWPPIIPAAAMAEQNCGTMTAENGWVQDSLSVTPLNHWHSTCFRSQARLLECAELALGNPAAETHPGIVANSGIRRCQQYPALVCYGCWSLAPGDSGLCGLRSRRLDSPNSKSPEASCIMYLNSSILGSKHHLWNLPSNTGTPALHSTYTSSRTESSPVDLSPQGASGYWPVLHAVLSPPPSVTYWPISSPGPWHQRSVSPPSRHSATSHVSATSKYQPPIDSASPSGCLLVAQNWASAADWRPSADYRH